MKQFSRINRDMGIMGGKACIKGTRVTVGMVVALVGDGKTREEILRDYPYLGQDDIAQALRYAAWSVDDRETEIAFA